MPWNKTQNISGSQGPAGPSAISTDAGNTSSLGSDGLIYTPLAAGDGFAPGTRMLFAMATAPLGWVSDTSLDNRALRVMSANGSTGGTISFSDIFRSGRSTDGHTLSESQMPSHGHGISDPGHSHGLGDPGHGHGVNDPGHDHPYLGRRETSGSAGGSGEVCKGNETRQTENRGTNISVNGSGTGIYVNGAAAGIGISNNGGNEAHAHGLPSFDLAYVDVLIAERQ